jgi:hypothetical protein
MSPLLTAVLMLCGLGAVTLTTTAGRRLEAFGAVGLSIVIAAVGISVEYLPDARWIGCAVAAIATVLVFRPNAQWIGPLCGGVLAGLLAVLLEAQGVAFWVAMPGAVLLPAASAYCCSRRPDFAPGDLRQEAMLATAALGLIVAMIPEVTAGWQSALALNREAETESGSSQIIIANWVLVLSAASVALGGLYTLLRHR